MDRDLAVVASEICAELRSQARALYFVKNLGKLLAGSENSAFQILEWDQRQGGWKDFLAVSKVMTPDVIYLEIRYFSCDEWDLDEWEDKDEAENLKSKDGAVDRVAIAFGRGGVWHIYQDVAAWTPDRADSTDADIDDEADDEDSFALSSEEIVKFAGEIARYPKFDLMGRSEVLSKLQRTYPDKEWEISRQMADIRREAQNIFETEIRPDIDRNLAKKAQKLENEGMNSREIAARLRLTLPVLSKIRKRYGDETGD